jgi:hypothetical protein
MIPIVGCEAVRGWLEGFADDELLVASQVVVETHLRNCETCAARVDDQRAIGTVLRHRARQCQQAPDGARRLAAMRAQVLAKVAADRSRVARWRDAVSEGLLLWPAVGATSAAALCLCVAFAVLHAASTERPESLAAMIDSLSNPGSDRNPMRLDGTFLVPRAVDASVALEDFGGDEAVVALSTVVNRDGTIATYELLQANRPASVAPAGDLELALMLGAVKQSRFAPAQAPGERVVAVNMVWLLARTTVRASGPGVDLAVPLTAPRPAKAAARRAPDAARELPPLTPRPEASTPA